MRIVVLDGYTENPGDLSWEGFERLGDFTVYDRTPPEKIISRIGDAEIIITNKTPLGPEVFSACPQIKYIGVIATGFNVVDIEAAKSSGIIVTNIPDYGTAAVAQYVFALLLEVCHRVGHHNEAVQAGRWTSCPDFCFWDYPQIELAGKTMGIIGFGRIGQNTAKIAQVFGMKVLAHTGRAEDIRKQGEDSVTHVSLDELFAMSDIISLHCPLQPTTHGIINKENIAKMKDGVILINTARGPLVNERDLREALDSGKVFAAATDVASSEPIEADNPLLGAKNCIITPHMAWGAKESRARLMDIAVANLEAFLAGSPINVVNR
ncbi:MAG: D-2-hydroxyacid dehydrogenase [Clostridiales bacterium]|nr:D-2-hydroxyacid dehydrogenase [Clostridiales bacterium]